MRLAGGALNIFRKVWLAAKVKAALGGNVDAIKAILGWLFKSKWAQGHRRQISVVITSALALITFLSGPIAGIIPALATPGVQHALLAAASYFGIIGELFKNDPATAP